MRKPVIAFVVAATVLTLSGLRAADLWRWRQETLRTAASRAANLSRVVAEYISEACAATDAALRQLALHSSRIGGPSAPDSEWAAALATAKASLAGVGSISVVDRDGIIQHSTLGRLVGQSRSDDAVFRTLRDASADELAIDTPFFTAVRDPQYIIPIGRRLTDGKGAFAGAVVATFVPQDLRAFFRAVGTGQHGTVYVFHPDGIVVFREPSEQDPIGSPARGNPIFDAASTTGEQDGVVSGWIDETGRTRIAAFRTTSKPPLIVAISLDRADALAEVRRAAIGSLVFFIAACLVIVWIVAAMFRQMDAAAGAQAALHRAQRIETERLQEANQLLTASLEREQRARQDAEAANALKDQFLMTVSHELRTPLTAIHGWARMLASGAVRDERRELAIRSIEKNARAQTRIVDDLLDAARVMNGKLRLDLAAVDAAAVLRDAIETVRPAAAAKELAIETAIEAPCDVVADGERLQQIAWNLLSNAVKFTPRGGAVRVQLRRDPGGIELVVADTGAGISPEFLPHAFDRFRQQDGGTSRRHGGLGLGLAIVRSLVELHGGTVAAQSDGLGRGATFTVRLPLSTAGAATTTKRPPTSGDLPGPARLAGVRVLVVDDDPEARALFCTVLENAGADVAAAGSAAEALACLSRQPCDVLLSDIEMPDEDGYTLVASAASLSARLGRPMAAIAVTAYSRPEDRARSVAAGFDAHLAKPIDPAALVSAIDDVRPNTVH